MSNLLDAVSNLPECDVFYVNDGCWRTFGEPLLSGFEGRHLRIVVVGTGRDRERLLPYLANALTCYGIIPHIRQASELTAEENEVPIVLNMLDLITDDAARAVEQVTSQLLAFVRGRAGLPAIFVPPTTLFGTRSRWMTNAVLADVVASLTKRLQSVPELLIPEEFLSVVDCTAATCVNSSSDQGQEEVFCSDQVYWGVAGIIADVVHRRIMPPIKCIAVDADNTLWSGIAGEEGGLLRIGHGHAHLHVTLQRARQHGVLIALVSKNNAGDTRSAFASLASEGTLNWEDFVAHCVNWDHKSINLARIMAELGVTPASMMFLDDDPRECLEVHQCHPDVMVINVPHQRHAEVAEFVLDMLPTSEPTSEDRTRSQMFSEHKQRARVLEQSTERDDVAKILGLQVTISPATSQDLARAAQLTQRANQFNVTNVRRSVEDLYNALADNHRILTVARAEDRLGSFGQVGVIEARVVKDRCEIEMFVLSCRAIGYDIELTMMQDLLERLALWGALML